MMEYLKRNWLVVSKLTWVVWRILTRALNVHFYGLLLNKAYNVWTKSLQRSYVSWHWRVTQNLQKNWLVVWKNDMRNLANFSSFMTTKCSWGWSHNAAPLLAPSKKGLSLLFSLAKKRIYLGTQLKVELTDLFLKLPGCSLYPQAE